MGHRELMFILLCSLIGTALPTQSAACDDADGDSFSPTIGCSALIDCNDRDWATHPGATETCDTIDNDCDGTIDEGCAASCDSPQREPVAHSLTPTPGGSQYMPMLARGLRGTAVSRASWDPVNCYRRALTIVDDANVELTEPLVLKGMSGPASASRVSTILWMGDRYFVTWHEGLPDSTCDAFSTIQSYFAVVSAGGQVLVPPTQLSCPRGGEDFSLPRDAVWDGEEIVVALGQAGFSTYKGTWLTRVTPDGQVLDGCGVRIYPDPENVSMAWNGTEIGIVFSKGVAGGPPDLPEIFFQRFTPQLQAIDPEPRRLTFDTTRSVDPHIVWGPGEWAVAWTQEFVAGYQEVGFMRIDTAGVLVTPPGVVKATSGAELPGAPDRLEPSIAWSGSEYGIVYHVNSNVTGSGDVYLSRISATGADLGPDPLLTPDPLKNAMFPEIVWNGVDYTVTWQDRTTAAGPFESMVAHVRCNCTDVDHDGFSTCGGDCDDSRFGVRPSSLEVCGNGLDDNCDRKTDCQDVTRCPAAGSLPPAPTQLSIGTDHQTVRWQAAAGASRYDLARGSLAQLYVDRDLESARCFASDMTQTMVIDAAQPNLLDGYFYLVRSKAGAANECRASGWGVTNETELNGACP